MGRTDAKVVAYNAQALTSLTAAAAAINTKLLVDDLYAAVDGKCGKNCAAICTPASPLMPPVFLRAPMSVRSRRLTVKEWGSLGSCVCVCVCACVRVCVCRSDKTCTLQRPKNVHFEPAGCAFMGAEVAKSVKSALGHE